jgi:hypothetical protein
VRDALTVLLATLVLGPAAVAQTPALSVPTSIEAGASFSVQCGGSGKGTLYIVGPGQTIKREVQLGQATSFAAGTLHNAGHYSVWLKTETSSETGALDVTPASKPSNLTFIAKPSRLQVGLHGGITGTVYVFDSYGNLITKPTEVQFELSNPKAGTQSRTVQTSNGAAWTQMDSTPHEGKDQFVARAGNVSSQRVIFQVPGDPCSLKMNAKPAGNKIELVTEPVRDCSGNPVPDGTIVTFTELDNGTKSTVDVPLKKGIASVQMPAHRGATISVASGVVLGNQVRWQQ